MNLLSFNLSLAILLPFLIFFASLFMSMRSYNNREKASPFECGFDPKNKARIPFSLRFFLLAIVFLVFDIEIALLAPLPILSNKLFYSSILPAYFFFMVILMLGLLHEWREGSLDWAE